MRARSFALALATLPVAGCVYYNAMWSAERLARDARRLEARPEAQAKLAGARSGEGGIHSGPPSAKRWADDALVLQERSGRSGSCAAAPALARALTVVSEEGYENVRRSPEPNACWSSASRRTRAGCSFRCWVHKMVAAGHARPTWQDGRRWRTGTPSRRWRYSRGPRCRGGARAHSGASRGGPGRGGGGAGGQRGAP
jgi:hypothetical protein